MRNKTSLAVGAIALVIAAGAAWLIFKPGPGAAPTPSAGAPSTDSRPVAGEPATTEAITAGEPDSAAKPEAVPAQLYGSVVDQESGAPIPHAELFVVAAQREARRGNLEELRSDEAALKTTADEGGSYEITVQPGEARTLLCAAEGYARGQHRLGENIKSTRLDFFLQPGGIVEGRVVDTDTREGVKGVTVTLARASQGMIGMIERAGDTVTQVSGDGGVFRLEGVRSGPYRLMARGREAGYVFRPQDAISIRVDAKTGVKDIELALGRGASVEGVVSDPQGNPVENAEINAYPARLIETTIRSLQQWDTDFFADLRGRSDAEGKFHIDGLSYEEEYRLAGRREGFADSAGEPFTIKKGNSPMQVDLTLTHGCAVAGTARFEDGEPAAAEKLWLWPKNLFSGATPPGRPPEAEAGADGAFRFERVGSGEYLVVARDQRAAPFAQAPEKASEVSVDGVKDVTGVEVTIIKPGEDKTRVISGVVLDPAGQPAPEIAVRARPMFVPMGGGNATTDAAGKFEIQGLQAGRFELTVSCPLGFAAMRAVEAGADVTIHLQPPTSVAGVVVDVGGAPVQGCAVELKSTGGEERGAGAMFTAMAKLMGQGGSKRSDENGYFEFEGVEPGQYYLKARHDTKGAHDTAMFDVVAGDTKRDFRLSLTPGKRLAGSVRDAAGQPVAGATLALREQEEDGFGEMMAGFMPGAGGGTAVTSGDDGAFEFDNVAAGTYTLTATHLDYAPSKERDIVFEGGRDMLDVRVTMTKGGVARGRFDVRGQPAAGSMVMLVGPDGFHMAMTNAEGEFNLANVAPGTYIAQAIDPSVMTMGGGMPGNMPQNAELVDIADGQEVEIDFGPGAGVAVSGQITGELGTITSISLRRPGGPDLLSINQFDLDAAIEAMRYQAGQAVANPDGTFTIEGVEPGTYLLDVYSINFDPRNFDPSQFMDMDPASIPHITQEITVGEESLAINLDMPAAGGR